MTKTAEQLFVDKIIKELNDYQSNDVYLADKVKFNQAKTIERIINQAILEPIKQIAANAGVDGSLILQRTISENKGAQAVRGYNAATGEFVEMVKAGIVDPTKVVRSALENAASAAMMFLTTEAVISDKPEKKEAGRSHNHDFDGGMGMM